MGMWIAVAAIWSLTLGFGWYIWNYDTSSLPIRGQGGGPDL